MDIQNYEFRNGRYCIWLTADDGASAKGHGKTIAEAYWNAQDALNLFREVMENEWIASIP